MNLGTLGLIGSAAGGVEKLRTRLVEPAMDRGWRVAVTLTPTAGTWLDATGERQRIEQATGLPCRVNPRMPGETSPHPPIDCYLVCPASANTVAKLALGLSDNQALTTVCEAIGARQVPVVAFPRINAAHTRQPAWNGHIEALHRAGVHLLMDDDYWPLHEPRTAPGKDLPWKKILDALENITKFGSSESV
ncbi:flavoprotein [Saccharopolyspora mangrovi]|uniref:Flavoprotein n=1 Tax=Saccharopolyspora mangrovi TaxID=3082379 RepID=A0ABU6A703_9PSEU|nr:flavoprotein [Saccharopolyspora sp. S2-29]MEB3367265.1 flavoprotein [Saccharopolyspora sp. S2-29]